MPPRKNACSKVVTIPQVTGTCWFNGMLMSVLYSQHSNKMMRRVIPLWAKDRKRNARLSRAYDLIHAMVMKYHTVKSDSDRKAAMEYFSTITPEHLLETLHNLSHARFKFNPVVHEGLNINYYISVLYKFLKVRPLILEAIETDNGDYKYHISSLANVDLTEGNTGWKVYTKKYTRQEIDEMMASDTYDCIVVSYTDDSRTKVLQSHWNIDSYITSHSKPDEIYPHTLKFKADNYKLDSLLLSSFLADACMHHAIAGVSCNNKRRVYNGWMRSTIDPAKQVKQDKSNTITDTAMPCELMEFDWNMDNSNFCINERQCSLDKVNVAKGLCFNFNKGDRIAFYVNTKFTKPHFKVPVAEERTPFQRTLPSISDKRKVLDDEKWDEKQRLCIRRVANWSSLKPYHKFDSASFNPKLLLRDLPTASPKLQVLLDTIEKLNMDDRITHGHNHKHFIFSDLGFGYGAKIIASALLAKGYRLAYNQNHQLTIGKEDSRPSFALLSSSTIYGKPLTQKSKKALLAAFNSRPENIYGANIQIIILDSGFKEGIDLFDVKYVHIFEPQISHADQRQVIGRATRTCGQKGLKFDPNQGWPLDVRIYDSQFSRIVRDRKYDLNTMHELYLSKSGIDVRTNNLVAELEKYSAQAAIDATLNKAIHSKESLVSNNKKDTSKSQASAQAQAQNKTKQKERKRKTVRKSTISQTGGIVAISPNKTPTKVIGKQKEHNLYKRWQAEVTKKHGKTGKWKVNGLENLCVDKPQSPNGASPSKAKALAFTPSQELIRKYLNPNMPTNGLLAYHSVGTGKTCSAIAAASTSFEKEGYTILWVTRTTLKADMWKNMFDQVCNVNLQHVAKMPKDMADRKRLLSKAWRIPPMSYRQFTNMLQGKNEFYQMLVSINGKVDPLRKTLLIIDEAHKLFNAEDLKSVEKPDTKTLYEMIRGSYTQSGADAVKLLLMTATPITNNPMDYIKLLNLFKTEDVAIPDNVDDFISDYLDSNTGKFTKNGANLFMNQIAGIVSYLNRERDARQFAQPRISIVNTKISERRQALEQPNQIELKYTPDEQHAKRKIDECKKRIQKTKQILAQDKLSSDGDIKVLKKQLDETMAAKKEAAKGNKEALKLKASEIRQQIAHLKVNVKAKKESNNNEIKELKKKSDVHKDELKKMRKDRARAKDKIKNDFSQERMMGLCAFQSSAGHESKSKRKSKSISNSNSD